MLQLVPVPTVGFSTYREYVFPVVPPLFVGLPTNSPIEVASNPLPETGPEIFAPYNQPFVAAVVVGPTTVNDALSTVESAVRFTVKPPVAVPSTGTLNVVLLLALNTTIGIVLFYIVSFARVM
jgi:hypothetical protein